MGAMWCTLQVKRYSAGQWVVYFWHPAITFVGLIAGINECELRQWSVDRVGDGGYSMYRIVLYTSRMQLIWK